MKLMRYNLGKTNEARRADYQQTAEQEYDEG